MGVPVTIWPPRLINIDMENSAFRERFIRVVRGTDVENDQSVRNGPRWGVVMPAFLNYLAEAHADIPVPALIVLDCRYQAMYQVEEQGSRTASVVRSSTDNVYEIELRMLWQMSCGHAPSVVMDALDFSCYNYSEQRMITVQTALRRVCHLRGFLCGIGERSHGDTVSYIDCNSGDGADRRENFDSSYNYIDVEDDKAIDRRLGLLQRLMRYDCGSWGKYRRREFMRLTAHLSGEGNDTDPRAEVLEPEQMRIDEVDDRDFTLD